MARTELTTPDATTPDASTRVLHLKAGSGDPTTTEQLTKWQPEKRCYAHVITQMDVAVLPVTNYASTLCVKDAGGKAEVVCKGGFLPRLSQQRPAGRDERRGRDRGGDRHLPGWAAGAGRDGCR